MAKAKDSAKGNSSAPVDAANAAIGEPVKRPRANAGPCPQSDLHTATRIYTTKGTTRHAVCDECGHTWKVIGPRADPDKQYLAELAEAFAAASTVTSQGEEVITLQAKLRDEVVKKLREIAGR